MIRAVRTGHTLSSAENLGLRGWAILALFVALVINHAAALPLFEASDEAAHFIFVHQLADGDGLPVIPTRDDLDDAAERGDRVAQWAIESHQPPLYYALAALLVAPTTQRADLTAYLVDNDVIFTWSVREGNPNVWLHPPHDTGGDTVRAVWLARLLNLGFGLATLAALYYAAQLATGSRPIALTAMLTAACLPMFVLVSGSVTNDPAIIFFSTAGVWWSLKVMRRGLSRIDAPLIGVILAAAALTKITGLSLFGLVFIALALAVWRHTITLRQAVMTFAVALAMVAALAGWWYVRNLTLYGDPLATAATAELWGRQFGTAGESGGWQELARIYNSFWLMVGHLHAPVWLPVGFYITTLALVAASVAGWVIKFGQRTPRWASLQPDPMGRDAQRRVRQNLNPHSSPKPHNGGEGWTAYMLSLLAAALPVGMLLVGTKDVDISYGRLLFPGLVGFMVLLAVGWHKLVGRFAPLMLVPLFITALHIPYTLTTPAYAPIAPVDGLPVSAVPLNVRADGVTLLGYEIIDRSATVGGTVRATVYLTPEADARPVVFALALTEGPDRLGGVTRYPGMASLDMLRPGTTYRAEFVIPVEAASDTPAPHLTQLQINLFDAPESPALTLTLPDGATTPVLTLDGAVYLTPDYTPPTPQTSVSAGFGDLIRLDGYTQTGDSQPGEVLSVVFDWTITGAATPDLSATLQLLDADGALMAQYDDPTPAYPSRVWLTETPLRTHHSLVLPADLPPGDYRLAVGWYRQDENFTRLPASAAETVSNLAVVGVVMVR
ncbi:MAG: phospholipid carrier-dependent glycosyltransferase [Anaerolineae bacterium]|jgi:4-amino-4-deoxy-L-arabinose transferase-like glycosyltransferase|nr:phospholipid carrier-dependent glycosyltransferase [Anaerolineae bacterium]